MAPAFIFGSVLKSRSLFATACMPFLLACMFLFSSCTKEEMVTPSQPIGPVSSKALAVPNNGTSGDPSNGNVRSTEDPNTNGDDISDDGDDISGTERKRR